MSKDHKKPNRLITNCPVCGCIASKEAMVCTNCGHPLRYPRPHPFHGLFALLFWLVFLLGFGVVGLVFLSVAASPEAATGIGFLVALGGLSSVFMIWFVICAVLFMAERMLKR